MEINELIEYTEKELNKIEEQLDDYISNTAAPEVLNIKKQVFSPIA